MNWVSQKINSFIGFIVQIPNVHFKGSKGPHWRPQNLPPENI